ncbi:MAG: hypothetical protein JO287_12765 [Pseudonocardiales bacterium]|nr:hypothetical protein [Pseudonocardiales bacterium]
MDTAAAGRITAKRAATVVFAIVAGWLVALGFGAASALADPVVPSPMPPVMTESFESGSGLPAGWRFVEYVQGNSTVAIVRGAAAEGTHFLRIVSRKPNHARVVVPVRVSPNTSYRCQVMAKASGANTNMAAVLGMESSYAVTGSVRTDTQWQPLDLYIKVGPQTSIDLSMGLGYFTQLNVGTADFDAVTVTKVSAIPNGAMVADLTTAPPAAAKPDTTDQSTSTQSSHEAVSNEVVWVVVGILVVVGIGAAVFVMRRGNTNSRPAGATESNAHAESD